MPAAKSTKPRKTTARKAKKSSNKSSDSTPVETVAAPEPVAAPVEVAPEPVATETVDLAASTEPTLEQQFKDILERIAAFRTLATNLNADVKRLQKNVNRTIRESSKRNRKRKGTDASGKKRPPSGFAKPGQISDALCQFLGVPSNTEMARTEVTKHLTKYIKAHSLQDEKDKRSINCDAALSGLLNVGPKDKVTYFNLQKFMKQHFISKSSTASA
jgi:chromatin remodeling complex protein RSC6